MLQRWSIYNKLNSKYCPSLMWRILAECSIGLYGVPTTDKVWTPPLNFDPTCTALYNCGYLKLLRTNINVLLAHITKVKQCWYSTCWMIFFKCIEMGRWFDKGIYLNLLNYILWIGNMHWQSKMKNSISQICKMKFGSWTYDGFQVDITNRSTEVDLSNYVINGEWLLLEVTVERNIVQYTCCVETFPDVTFYVHIRRRTLYYMYNVIFPCIMMSSLTLLVFCLPPDSGEKIALGITVLLAFSVFMLAVAENLPETSEFVPLISEYRDIGLYIHVCIGCTLRFQENAGHENPYVVLPVHLSVCYFACIFSKCKYKIRAFVWDGYTI